jgi:decaprenyl-phosphate phosphoribosyltransferase
MKVKIPGYIHLLRIRQWHKNFLVVAPLIASGNSLDHQLIPMLGFTFFGFCILSSTIYVMNDLKDIELDKKNSANVHRPLPSGAISVKEAILVLIFLIILDLSISIFLDKVIVICFFAYVIINIAYTFKLKNIPVVEIFCITSGFLLRALAGSISTNTQLSQWFLLVLSSGSIFLIVGKRISEKRNQNIKDQRNVLELYSTYFLYAMLAIAGATCVNSFALWSFNVADPNVYVKFSSITFSICIFRYLWHLDLSQNAFGGKPEKQLFEDLWLVASAITTGLLVMSTHL